MQWLWRYPVALPPGSFTPINGMNTVYLYNALWAMLMPVSASFGQSDIWRSLWQQRLLWDIGEIVSVAAPFNERTVLDVDPIRKFKSDEKMIASVFEFSKVLFQWRSESTFLFDRVLDLTFELCSKGFCTQDDIDLTAAWLKDLISLNYVVPKVSSWFNVPFGELIYSPPDVLPLAE